MQLASQLNTWSLEEMVVQDALVLALAGRQSTGHCDSGMAEAPTQLMHVSSWPPNTRVNLGACATDIQMHTRRSYSNFDTAAQEIALQASLRGYNQQFGCGLGGGGEG